MYCELNNEKIPRAWGGVVSREARGGGARAPARRAPRAAPRYALAAALAVAPLYSDAYVDDPLVL